MRWASSCDKIAAMNAFNPLESMKRLEASGVERRHAEAIAGEILEVRQLRGKLLPHSQRVSIFDCVTVRLAVVISVFCLFEAALLGVLISIK
jgi:hypothetical protein